MKHPQRHRSQLSVALLGLQIVAAVLHAFPALVYPRGNATTTRIVVYISQLGPVWVIAFGLTALVLAGLLTTGRGLHFAHLACAAVWVMYASSLWVGALGSDPRGTVFFPCLATTMVIVHVITASSYNDFYGREARR